MTALKRIIYENVKEQSGNCFYYGVPDPGVVKVLELLKEGRVFLYDAFKLQPADSIDIKRYFSKDRIFFRLLMKRHMEIIYNIFYRYKYCGGNLEIQN